MKLKEGFMLRRIAGENVVVPLDEDMDQNMMITLNNTGCLLWQKLEEGADLDQLTAALTGAFKVDEATAAAHAAAFVKKLEAHNFLQ